MHNELTEIDIQKMKEELSARKAAAQKLREAVKEARALGDLSENDEYRSAKRELGRNNSRIRYLENMLKTAIIVKTDSTEGVVGLFDEIELQYENTTDGEPETRKIRLVTTLRNDVFNNCISKESPLGRAIFGRRVGERVNVHVNDKVSYPVIIKSVIKGHDDPNLPITAY